MIDLHSHILPNLDDGSKNLEMSIRIAEKYVENGFERVVATPHFFDAERGTFVEDVLKSVEDLNIALFDRGIDLKILPGNEIYLSPTTVHDIQSKIALSINNTRFVLLEFPSNDIPRYSDSVIYELQIKGYFPIISHPERNSKIIENPNLLFSLIEKGALVQMNLQSLEGMYGKSAMDTANILLKHNMIHLLGTDSHSDGRRSPEIISLLKLLEKKIGNERYWKIVYENPERVVNDRPIVSQFHMKVEKNRSFINMFGGIFLKS